MTGIEVVIKEAHGGIWVECAGEEAFEIRGNETVKEILGKCKEYQSRVLRELGEMVARLVIGKD